MKRIITLTFLLGTLVFLADSCKKENQTTTFYERAVGIWVPYEIISAGTVSTGPFTANSIFGTYAESFKLNTDRTFIPVMWTSNTDYLLKTDEQGTVTYTASNERIKFDAPFTYIDCVIVKFQDNELWLDMNGILYKLIRKL
jgi:hypothetical protein